MSGVIPTVLSPGRVSQALASVGAPAGSGGLRVSANDPLAPGSAAPDKHSAPPAGTAGAANGRPRTPSPSRIAATTLPKAPASPFTTDALTSPAAGGAAATTRRVSVSGNGDGGSAGNSARSMASRARAQAAHRTFHSRPDSPRTAGGRVHLGPEASSTSISAYYPAPGGGSAGLRAYQAASGSTRGAPGGRGLVRDRSFASTTGSTAGHFRLPAGSMNGGFTPGLDSLGSQLGLLGRPMGLQPAPGTVGGIDIARLAAIQRLLDEYESDDGGGGNYGVGETASSPRGEGSAYRHRSESMGSGGAGGEGARQRISDSGSASGLRKLASLRSRKDMQHWQPSVSTVKGSLEEHQQRLRERADVTQSLKRWAEQVLEDARRAAGGTPSTRESDIARASSVRFKDPPGSQDGGGRASPAAAAQPSASPLRGFSGGNNGALEFLDPEQELDDEEERRLEALMALPPNPRGLGVQLRAHFMAVVEEEVNRKFESMRAKWEEQKGHEAEELRELRESHKELRRTHMETKDALDKANTRLDVMRLQMKAGAAFNKAGKEAAAAIAAAGDGDGGGASSKGGNRTQRSSNHDGAEGKSGGGKGRSSGSAPPTASNAAQGQGHSAEGAPPAAAPYYGVDDELHDKLKSIGSRRPTEPSGDLGAVAAAAELQQQLRAHADAAMTLNRKLQDAEQQLAKLKVDKVSLENQLTAARSRAGDPSATGDGAGGGGGNYDSDVQIFRLKQEKAALEQQLAAAARKTGGGGGGKGAAVTKGGVSVASGRTSIGSGRGAASASAASGAGGKVAAAGSGGAAAAGRAAELAADCERLQSELAAARREASNSAREAVDRRMELQKAREELAAAQVTLDLALKQIAGVKDAAAAEKERADRAAAAVEAAEAAKKRAEASATAANSAAAAALIKRSAATGEVQELLVRLETERDAAMTAADEAHEQLRELSKTLGLRTEEVMQLRDQLLQRQMDTPTPSAARAAADAGETAASSDPPLPEAPAASAAAAEGVSGPPPSSSLSQAQLLSQPPAAAGGGGSGGGGGGYDLFLDSRVTAAAVAAMQSLGVPLRPPASTSRRRPTSALGPGAAAAGVDGAVGVAAAAAAAAALVPAVLEVMRQRLPDMVMALGGDLAEGSAAESPPGADAGGAAAADAAAAAAAAAAATLRESGNAAAAAAAGATAAAPVIASAFVEMLRGELLNGVGGGLDMGLVLGEEGGYWEAGQGGAAGSQCRARALSAVMAAAGPPPQLLPRGMDQSLAFRNAAAEPSGVAVGDAEGEGSFATAAAAAAAAAAVDEAAAGGGLSARPSSSVTVEGVTFQPLGVRDAARGAARRSMAASSGTFLTGLQELTQSQSLQAPLHSPPLPHHTPYFEAAAAAVAAAAADLLPQTVSVPVHPRRHSLVSASAAAASRRRRNVFAQLHSSYFPAPPTAAAAAGAEPTEAPAADSDSQPPTPSGPPILEEGLLVEGGDGDVTAAAPPPQPRAPSPSTPGRRVARSAVMSRDADGGSLEAYGSVYVDPELASVLHVERVSAAAARAAGAGRGAISPEALGPSLRDRALSSLQVPEPLPPPQRPQSAAVRTLEAARLHILHSGGGYGGGGGGGGGRLVQSARPLSAVLPPVAGASPAVTAAGAAEAPPIPEAFECGGSGGGSPGQQPQQPQSQMVAGQVTFQLHQQHPQSQQQHPSGSQLLAGTGVKIRTATANPQKGVQLPGRPRSTRQPSARGLPGRSGGEGVRFEDEEAAAAAAAAAAAGGASVSGRLLPGWGLSTPIREVQLHKGPPHRGGGGGAAATGTYFLSPEAAATREGGGGGGEGGDAAVSELPTSGPELAALARGLMAAQERAVRELEEAMNTRRELAEEVMTSRQHWLEEARRARALEQELSGVREVLMSLGIGGPLPGRVGAEAGAGGARATDRGRSSRGAGGGGSP